MNHIVHHKDSRGRLIEVEQTVAYNRSGDVIEGTIVHLTSFAIHIEPHSDFRRKYQRSAVSKVKHGRSVLILS